MNSVKNRIYVLSNIVINLERLIHHMYFLHGDHAIKTF